MTHKKSELYLITFEVKSNVKQNQEDLKTGIILIMNWVTYKKIMYMAHGRFSYKEIKF